MTSPPPDPRAASALEPGDPPRRTWRATLGLFLLVVGVALLALWLLLQIDIHLGWQPTHLRQGMTAALDSLAEVMAAVLGLSLTVVAIVVQLASSRYPAKIVDLFMTDPINLSIFGLMTSSCIYVILTPALAGGPLPLWVSGAALLLTVLNLGLLLPYFGHVFAFLEPNNIITQIQERADDALKKVLSRRDLSGEEIAARQRQVANALERIADNSMAAIDQSDRNLSMHTVRTLQLFLSSYLPLKPQLPPAWAEVPSTFLSTLAKEFLDDIFANMTWVEAKVLMEYERIFRKALGEMTELVSQISASTRGIGEQAMRYNDIEARDLVVQFFNTYLRHTLNARNVRAAYNVLYEYRHFASAMLGEDPAACVRVVKHLVYYGRTANAMHLPFVTVTVAHDVRVLCQEAFDHKLMVDMGEMLRLFLTLDQPNEDDRGEVALLGVRRAQSILGAFFLNRGAIELAEQIRFDMRDEPPQRLRKIRDDILIVDEHKFWEVTDRGFNFDWVPPEMRHHVTEFFSPMLAEYDAVLLADSQG